MVPYYLKSSVISTRKTIKCSGSLWLVKNLNKLILRYTNINIDFKSSYKCLHAQQNMYNWPFTRAEIRKDVIIHLKHLSCRVIGRNDGRLQNKNLLFTTQTGWRGRGRGRRGCSFSSCVMGGVLVSLNNARTIMDMSRLLATYFHFGVV